MLPYALARQPDPEPRRRSDDIDKPHVRKEPEEFDRIELAAGRQAVFRMDRLPVTNNLPDFWVMIFGQIAFAQCASRHCFFLPAFLHVAGRIIFLNS